MWSAASADERRAIAANVAERRPALDKSLTAADLRHYLAHLGELPGADEVRLALASFLIERGRSQEAEIELLQLLSSTDDATQTAADGTAWPSCLPSPTVWQCRGSTSHGHAVMWMRKWCRPPRSMPRKIVRGRPASPRSSRTAIDRYAWSRTIRRGTPIRNGSSPPTAPKSSVGIPSEDDVLHWAVDQGNLSRSIAIAGSCTARAWATCCTSRSAAR